MFLPRADGESDGCPSGHVYCTPSGTAAIVGNQSGDSDSGGDIVTSYSNKPGMHRFIGIAMVIVLLVVAIVSWLCYIKRTRKETWLGSARAMLCCWSRRKTTSILPSTSGSEAFNVRPVTPVVFEKDQSTMMQSEPRGLVKEVSGGVVMFTEAPRAALPGKDRYPIGWEFEHVDGVRFEARSPYHQPRRSLPPRPKT